MIQFEDLALKNWKKWKKHVLQSELIFPESIREEEESFLELLKTPNNVAKIMRLDDKYIGNALGHDARYNLDPESYALLKSTYSHDASFNKGKMIYLTSIVIDRPYQKKGYGTKLLQEFIKEAKKKGYNRLVGVFRPDESLPLIKKLGGKEISIQKNWFDTGEDYGFCELDIH